ncbi:MAG: hypothetical protein HW387_1275 [Parachlamydiales bacterium]|nr:hypothetical protein [Parachlamydiales bacterium]
MENINSNPQQIEPPPLNNSLITMMDNSEQLMATNNLALQALCQSFKAQNQSMRTHNQTLQTQSQTLQTLDQSLKTQNQRLEKHDQALQSQRKLQEAQNQELTESLVQLSTDLDRNIKLGVVIQEGLDEIHSNQQGILWIMNGIARLFWPFGRRPTPITPPPLLSPSTAVVTEEIQAEANHSSLGVFTANRHGRIVQFFLWISAPIRWVWRCVTSIFCKLGLKRRD